MANDALPADFMIIAKSAPGPTYLNVFITSSFYQEDAIHIKIGYVIVVNRDNILTIPFAVRARDKV